MSFSSYFITPKELSQALKSNPPPGNKISTDPRVIPLCATWFLPNDPQGRTGLQAFKNKRVPGARFFDIDGVKDHESKYPHMLPTSEGFAEAMRDLGIRKDDGVVVYDSEEVGIFSAPRAAWTLRVFGHSNVHILNNFKLWVEEGYPTESGEPSGSVERSSYAVPSFHPDMVVKFAEMKTIGYDYGKEGADQMQILDARSKGRWEGTEPEPRPGLRSGHMPGSTSLPFQELLHPKTKTILPKEELRKVFDSKSVDPKIPIIASCGTGVTAAIVEAGLAEAEYGPADDRRIYDGSWT